MLGCFCGYECGLSVGKVKEEGTSRAMEGWRDGGGKGGAQRCIGIWALTQIPKVPDVHGCM